ncbi:MAG: cytidylate kinase [Candidatus Marinimicrobia bacterium]|nr:cytidylate kinase [Candidatus Neomarinimicrobiota bacterium]
MIIAIDGPAGSGKSTTARLLAKKLDFIYLDTGAMYRAVTLFFLDNKIDLTNSDEVSSALNKINLKIENRSSSFNVFVQNTNVNNLIRDELINKNVSNVSEIYSVRKKMVEIQREFSSNKDIVIEGRDIGSHVFPNADYKFYIEADINVRASRRMKDLSNANKSLDDMCKLLLERDKIDSNRNISPLIKPKDAYVVDTTSLSIEEQVIKLFNIITNN